MLKKVMVCNLWVIGLIIFLSFLQVGCYAQQPKDSGQEPKENNLYTWDFGQAKEGVLLKHNFILKNESTKSLNIKALNTSCGCTVSKIKKKRLMPGENTLIEVQFNTKDYLGPVQQFVYVHTDSLDASTTLGINSERSPEPAEGRSESNGLSRTIDNPIIRYIIKADITK